MKQNFLIEKIPPSGTKQPIIPRPVLNNTLGNVQVIPSNEIYLDYAKDSLELALKTHLIVKPLLLLTLLVFKKSILNYTVPFKKLFFSHH